MADNQCALGHLTRDLFIAEKEDVLFEAEQVPFVTQATLHDVLHPIDQHVAVHGKSDLRDQLEGRMPAFTDGTRRDYSRGREGHRPTSHSRESIRAWSKDSSPLMIICRITE